MQHDFLFRRIRNLILFVFLTGMLLPAPGRAADAAAFVPGSELSGRFDPPPRAIQALACFEGALYLASDSLYALSADGGARVQPLDDFFGPAAPGAFRQCAFVQDEHRLGLLDTRTGTLAFLKTAADAPAPGERVQLSWDDYVTPMDGYTQVEAPRAFALAGDTLCALDSFGAPITRFDLRTGQKLPPARTSALRVIPYRDGRLLLIQAKEPGASEASGRTIAVYDPARDAAQAAGTLDAAPGALGDAAYDFAGDALLAVCGDIVYRCPGLADARACATLPLNDGFMEQLPIAALPGRLAAVATRGRIFVKDADPDAFARKTTLRMLLAADGAQGLSEAMNLSDGVNLSVRQARMDPLAFAQQMVTGAEEDLFWVKLSQADFVSVMKKGYALNLADSAALREDHGRLYEQVRAAVAHGDGIYGLPMTACGIVLLGDEQIVFDENRQPRLRTLDDLLDFLARWQDAYAADHPGMTAFGDGQGRYALCRLALETYIDGCAAAGQPLHFDTPELRQTLARIEALDEGALAGGGGEDYAMPALFSNEWLMSPRLFDGDGRDSNTFLPLLLSVSEDRPAPLPMEVTCVFVNARTRHPKEALAFLEALAQCRSHDNRILLSDQDNEPVDNPRYAQIVSEHEALIARKRAELSALEGADRGELAAWLARAEQHHEEIKATQRYLISPDNIRAYRALAGHAFVRRFNGEAQGAQAAMDMLPQYTDGSLTLDMFLSEAENRLNLIRLESQ